MRSLLALAFVLACSPTGDGPRPAVPATPASAAAPDPQPQPSAPPSTNEAAAPSVAKPSAPARTETLELTFVGDVIFGRYRASGFDPIPEGEHAVFDDMAQQLASDVVVGN